MQLSRIVRLWSLHPKHLDSKGLVALWREGLLAQKVLQGGTRGYRNHPQLMRFQETSDPRSAIATYLHEVLKEAVRRGYRFDVTKVGRGRIRKNLSVASGQLEFELAHLRKKLWRRDRSRYLLLKGFLLPAPHPLFTMEPGPIESWEVVRP